MTLSVLKLVGTPSPPVNGGNTLPSIISMKGARPLQVINGHKLRTSKTICVSRRDALICLTAGMLSGLTIFTAVPANARRVNPETRRKIFKKLEQLREEAGVSKPKTETGKNPSSGKDQAKPSRNPIGNPVQPLVKANLP